MNEYKIIQEFTKELKDLIKSKKGVSLETELFLKIEDKMHVLDAVLVKNKEALAIFEFKSGQEKILSKDFLTARPLFEISYKFLIVSNGRNHRVLDIYSDEVSEYTNTSDLINYLLNIPSTKIVEENKSKIAAEIENVVLEFLETVEGNSLLDSNKTKLGNHFSKEKIEKHLRFDKDGQFYHLSADIRDLSNFENTFFKLLTQEVKSTELIYRYTTLDTVFSTIDYKSLRLNGIAGMNDISEVGYVETYLDKTFIPLQSIQEVEELNKRFILCSSVLSDDLMQWRLYGDDSKGACLVFSINSGSKLSGLQIRRISYGILKNGKNYHPELELIQKIMMAVKNIKQSFQFRALTIWKHFFKSFEYSPEKEVRLLLILSNGNSIKGEGLISLHPHVIDKKWCLTSSHKIATPFITLPLEDQDLPINLEQVILGSKCPELITNKKQFEQVLREKGLTSVIVDISKINNYR